MVARSAVLDLKAALQRERSDAAARTTSETAHFLRFAACLQARPHPYAKA